MGIARPPAHVYLCLLAGVCPKTEAADGNGGLEIWDNGMIVMTLDELKEGQRARIFKVKGRGAFRQRLVEMGFVKGQTVETLRFAPMKDPVEFRILRSEVSLRRDEAALIEIDLIGPDGKADLTRTATDGAPVSAGTPASGTTAAPTAPSNAAAFPYGHKETIEVCMVGNPNAGKTSLYNALSGAFEHVANYSGVTVDAKRNAFDYRDYRIELTDLPGTYSFSPYTPEERFVREHLLFHKPDVVLNVIDASNIERNLYLTTQLIDMDCKVVLAMNMFDELKKTGARLDAELLGQLLGMPVVPTVASRHEGLAPLVEKIAAVYNDAEPHLRHTHIPYPEEIETAIHKLQEAIRRDPAFSDMYSSRFLAIKLLEEDTDAMQPLHVLQDFKGIEALAQAEIKHIKAIFDEDPAHLLSDARYAFVRGALKEAYTPADTPSRQKTMTDRLDSILTHRLWGFPIFLFFLWVMFQTTFALGQYPMDWIDNGVDALCHGLEQLLPNGMLKAMLLDGILRGIGGVIVFLPNILILFTFISFMETTGYMARVAFIMDRLMHTIGLHGKSFIPLIIGFGCNVPAVMATRTIENRKDRLITMLIVPFMSCSARLPIYILLVGAFFPAHAGSVIFLIYLAGIAVSILSALLFRKTLLPSAESPFVMEIPPYRWPNLKSLLYGLWMKTKAYLKKMGGIILVASLVIWALGYFPLSADGRPADISASYLGAIGRSIEPALRPLGFDWKMGISLLAGISAKEVVVSTLSVLVEPAQAFTPLTAASFLAFVLLYLPCIAVFSAVRKESGSWKWPLFMAFYTTAIAYLVALLVYNVGQWFI